MNIPEFNEDSPARDSDDEKNWVFNKSLRPNAFSDMMDPQISLFGLSDEEGGDSNEPSERKGLKSKKKVKRKLKKGKKSEETDDNESEKKKFFKNIPLEKGNISFHAMKLSPNVMKIVKSMGYVHPTPIQSAAIPQVLRGRDICGCAATGTGKTAAYMLPILEKLQLHPKEGTTAVLILAPTRELAVQIYQVTRQMARFVKVNVALAAGGTDLDVQESVLQQSPEIVIGTPGRIVDHLLNCRNFTLNHIEMLVIDEADMILGDVFSEHLQQVIDRCPKERQTLLFSATMTDEVKDLAALSLTKPVHLFVNSNMTVAMNLRQEFVRVAETREGDREAMLAALVLRDDEFKSNSLVFFQTKRQVHRMRLMFELMGLRVAELHKDCDMAERLKSLKMFRESEMDILLSTDLAARGLDIPHVKTVINFTLPATLQQYIHRVGRTARAGRCGRAISFVGAEERDILKEIVGKATTPVKRRTIPPDVITKFRTKIDELETDVMKIIKQEKWEIEMKRAEKQLTKADTIMKGGKKQEGSKRTWHQSRRDILLEKKKFRLGSFDRKGKAGMKPENTIEYSAAGRVRFELGKINQFRVKAGLRELSREEKEAEETRKRRREERKESRAAAAKSKRRKK